jgi:hypothetical protein
MRSCRCWASAVCEGLTDAAGAVLVFCVAGDERSSQKARLAITAPATRTTMPKTRDWLAITVHRPRADGKRIGEALGPHVLAENGR